VTLGFAFSAVLIGALEVTGLITAALACDVVPVLPTVSMQATNAAVKTVRLIIGQPLPAVFDDGSLLPKIEGTTLTAYEKGTFPYRADFIGSEQRG
jgi:hypothetical protein